MKLSVVFMAIIAAVLEMTWGNFAGASIPFSLTIVLWFVILGDLERAMTAGLAAGLIVALLSDFFLLYPIIYFAAIAYFYLQDWYDRRQARDSWQGFLLYSAAFIGYYLLPTLLGKTVLTISTVIIVLGLAAGLVLTARIVKVKNDYEHF